MADWEEVARLILADVRQRGQGAELRSEAEYMSLAGCGSIQPVKRAMQHVAELGLISRRRGVRATVNSIFQQHDHSLGFRESAERMGYRVENDVLEQQLRKPNLDVEREKAALDALGLRKDERFLVLVRRRLFIATDDLRGQSKSPWAVHWSFLNAHFLAPLEQVDFRKARLLEEVEKLGFKPVRRRTTVRARLPQRTEVRLLNLPPADPVLVSEQVLTAVNTKTNEEFAAEFLHAVYLAKWEFTFLRQFERHGQPS